MMIVLHWNYVLHPKLELHKVWCFGTLWWAEYVWFSFQPIPCWWRLIPMKLWYAEQKEKQGCHKTAYNYVTSKLPLSNFEEENMRISICEDEGDGNPSTIFRHVSRYKLCYDVHQWFLSEGSYERKRGGELKWLGSWTQYNMSLCLALKSRLTQHCSEEAI